MCIPCNEVLAVEHILTNILCGVARVLKLFVWFFFYTCSLRLLFCKYSPDNVFEFLKSTNLSSKI